MSTTPSHISLPLGEALLPPISAQASPSAGRPVTVAPNARQVAAAAISAFSTPLPPRRLEPEKTRIASAGQVRVAAAQKAHLGDKASARVARGPSAASPVAATQNGRQIVAAAISPSSAPLPPHRPEPEKTRIASAGHVRVAAAQNAQLGERASARVAQPAGSFAGRPVTAVRNSA